MKMDTHSLPDDPTPADAPPSYDTLGAGSSNQDHRSEKYPRPVIDQPAGPSRPSLRSPLRSPPALPPNSPSFSSSGPTPTNNKEKERAGSWFGFIESPQARTTREVRTTVLGLLRRRMRTQLFILVLSSSREVDRKAHSFYWAIIKRMPDGHHDVEEQQGPDLLSALISYASPLTKDTITELRLACLTTSDQVLFQRLRLFPEFAPASGADRVLFGMTIPPESIEVEDLPEMVLHLW
ncbi:hypothetical protein BDZ97DRAFT_1920057 [Flammula alnicola]|nr:hypothetical protein BDZ97DRAFT_1920057 [Flammula alnicola]